MKQKVKGKNCAVFCFAGFFFQFFFCYEVFAKQKKNLRCRLYYLDLHPFLVFWVYSKIFLGYPARKLTGPLLVGVL